MDTSLQISDGIRIAFSLNQIANIPLRCLNHRSHEKALGHARQQESHIENGIPGR